MSFFLFYQLHALVEYETVESAEKAVSVILFFFLVLVFIIYSKSIWKM